MNISIKATNIELTLALRDYTEKRMRGISKFTEGDANIVVDIGKTTLRHKGGDIFQASVNVTTVLGRKYYATSKKADLYEAIDDIRSEVIHEITSAKGKRETLFLRGARKIKKILKGFR